MNDNADIDPKKARRRRRSFFDDSNAEFSNLMQSINGKLASLSAECGEQPARAQPPPMPPMAPASSPPLPVLADICVVSFDALLRQGALMTFDGLLSKGVDIVIPYAVLNLVDEESKTDHALPDRDLTAPIAVAELKAVRLDHSRKEDYNAMRGLDWAHSLDRGNVQVRIRLMKEARNWFLHTMIEADRLADITDTMPLWSRRSHGRLIMQRRSQSITAGEALPHQTQTMPPPSACWCCWRDGQWVADAHCPVRISGAANAVCAAGSMVGCARYFAVNAPDVKWAPPITTPTRTETEKGDAEEDAADAKIAPPLPVEIVYVRRPVVVLATEDASVASMVSGTSVVVAPLHQIQPNKNTVPV